MSSELRSEVSILPAIQEVVVVRIAGIQIACSQVKEKNIDRAITLMRLAVERGAKIICLQELFHTHWFPKDINQENFGQVSAIFSFLILDRLNNNVLAINLAA